MQQFHQLPHLVQSCHCEPNHWHLHKQWLIRYATHFVFGKAQFGHPQKTESKRHKMQRVLTSLMCKEYHASTWDAAHCINGGIEFRFVLGHNAGCLKCGLITNHSFTTSTPMSHMQWVSATPEANPVCSLPAPKALQATYQMLHRCRTPNATPCTCASRMHNTGEAAIPIATLSAHTLRTAGHAHKQSWLLTRSYTSGSSSEASSSI